MPPDKRSPNDPFEWLNRAKSNLERAKSDIRLTGVYLEDLSFDAQQAVEKSIIKFQMLQSPFLTLLQ